ncbi:hypothetical protein A2U01_0002285, partial [Trifolium medium]|nr:hypothetical protein [Trifolium medium]
MYYGYGGVLGRKERERVRNEEYTKCKQTPQDWYSYNDNRLQQVTDVPGPNTMRRRFGLLVIGMFHSYSLKSENCSYYESCSTQKAWMIEQEHNKVIIHI